MRPILFELPFFNIAVPAYGTLILFAAIICIWIGPRWIYAREGLPIGRVRWALVAMGVLVFVGGRAHFVFNHWMFFQGQLGAAMSPGRGGLHAGGAIAALAVGLPPVLRAFRLPLGKFADGLSLSVGIGIGVARIGCFLRGCCFGRVCDLPWGVVFPSDAFVINYHQQIGLLTPAATAPLPVHPLQLYFSAAGFALTGVAAWMYRRKRYDGQVALVVLFAYALSAAILEFIRADHFPRNYWGPLPQLEWTALILMLLALAGLVLGNRIRTRK